MPESRSRAYLIFTESETFLALSSYPDLTDPRLLKKLRFKGIEITSAYEIGLDTVEEQYSTVAFRKAVEYLETNDDLRVIDFDGQKLRANFPTDTLGEPVITAD